MQLFDSYPNLKMFKALIKNKKFLRGMKIGNKQGNLRNVKPITKKIEREKLRNLPFIQNEKRLHIAPTIRSTQIRDEVFVLVPVNTSSRNTVSLAMIMFASLPNTQPHSRSHSPPLRNSASSLQLASPFLMKPSSPKTKSSGTEGR